MSEWQPMEAYPDKGRRDENGHWTDEAGPDVELLCRGEIISARWFGKRTQGGGEVWAFWEVHRGRAFGFWEPEGWRLANRGLAVTAA